MKKQLFDRQRRKTILSAVVTVLLICTVLMCFSVIVQVLTKGHASIGGYSFFRVVTGSMEPTIPVGALIVCKSVDIHVLDVGDIVCFRSQYAEIYGQSITHRVIGISQNADGVIQLQTKGDYNLAADSYYVTADNLIGKVVWWSDQGNVFSDIIAFFSNRISFLTFIVFPCLVISGLIFRNSVKGVTKGLAEAKKELREIRRQEEEEKKANAPAGGSAIERRIEPSETSFVKAKDLSAPKTRSHALDGDVDVAGKGQGRPNEKDIPAGMDSREYTEMYNRLRAELLEELRQEYDREKTK